MSAALKAAFTLTPDDDPMVEELGNDRYAIVAVGDVIEAAPRPLTEIKDRVAADLIRTRAFEQARALATITFAQVKAGIPLAPAFALAEIPVPQPVRTPPTHIAPLPHP